MNELAEKLKRIVPYFDLKPNGAYGMHAYRHPLRPSRTWQGAIPIALVALISLWLLDLIEFDQFIRPFPIPLYVLLMAAAAVGIIYLARKICASAIDATASGMLLALALPVSWLAALIVTGILQETLLEHAEDEVVAAAFIALHLVGLAVCAFVLFSDELNEALSDKTKEQLRELAADPAFLEFYNSEENVRRGWCERGHSDSFRSAKNIALIDEMEVAGRLAPPALTDPPRAPEDAPPPAERLPAVPTGRGVPNQAGRKRPHGAAALLHARRGGVQDRR